MKKKDILSAKSILSGTNISIVDAARLVRNILDYRENTKLTDSPIEFCNKIIEAGKRQIRSKEMSIYDGLVEYIKSKSHLRKDSFRDIKYISHRLIKIKPEFANRNFSEFSVPDCKLWLSSSFSTPSQFNKARTMLHGFFEFAIKNEWCDRNPIRLIERKKVIEKEIKPLTIKQTKRILENSEDSKYKNCAAGAAILTLAGIRPREVRRLKWRDIDLAENSITVRSQCSKTGGVRQVEICPALKRILKKNKSKPDNLICSPNWNKSWKSLRDDSGFKGRWIQDILRHTYASYHAKHFHDLPRLQLNMGHRDQSLLRSRYINMGNITRNAAKMYFI